jgi:hypothetical protein
MRIAAHIGVLNEVGLIGHCIDNLRAIGVEQFIVCDMDSIDGTREVLRREQGPDFRVIESTNAESQENWMRRNLEAVKECSADWVVMADADEFPLTAEGDLHCLLESIDADLIKVPRFNVALGPRGLRMPFPVRPETHSAIDLYVKEDLDRFRADLQTDPRLYLLRFAPPPKIVVRPDVIGDFCGGMHDAIPKPGAELRRVTATNIIIAHVALSDYDRFALKIEHAREMFRLHDGRLPPDYGWHWRRWIDQADRGQLRAEYERSILSEADIASLRGVGVIRTAAEMLAAGSAETKRTSLKSYRDQVARLSVELELRRSNCECLNRKLEERATQISRLRADSNRLQAELSERINESDRLRQRIDSIHGSICWRLTLPIRWLHEQANRAKSVLSKLRLR